MHVAFGVSMALAAAAITTAPVAAPLEATPAVPHDPTPVTCESTGSVETTPLPDDVAAYLEYRPVEFPCER